MFEMDDSVAGPSFSCEKQRLISLRGIKTKIQSFYAHIKME